jgi:hypothetical protein
VKTHSQVQTLLSKPVKKIDRVKASFNLDRQLFEGLKAICIEREITQTELLEAMIADLLAQVTRMTH